MRDMAFSLPSRFSSVLLGCAIL